jgi:hypothetical protein
MRDVAANGGFTHADVDHIGVGGGDGDTADRGALEEAIGDVFPEETAVRSLPDAATCGAEIEGVAMAGIASDGDDTATAIGADAAPLQRGEEAGSDGVFVVRALLRPV